MSLFLRNAFGVLLCPGTVVIAVPYLLLGRTRGFSFSLGLWQIGGIVICIAGSILLFHSILQFAIKGQGTLSLVNPTKKLVVTGFHKYTRNPMYFGVIVILLGEIFFFQTPNLLLYTIIIFLCFNLFIRFYEEPKLTQKYDAEYGAYRSDVRRWL
jgi:protein-S-isoprenylcysteine O-methyltransferase Ste14